jgi:hydrogenase/urease accessory protein HupE
VSNRLRLRTWTAAVLITAAVSFGFPAAAIAHDPGLSSLELRVTARQLVAVLSLAPADARAALDSSGDIHRLALDSIVLRMDGVRLIGTIERVSADVNIGTSVQLAFDRPPGSRLTIGSDVPGRLGTGHRELLSIRGADGRLLAERMLDMRVGETEVDLRAGAGSGEVASEFFTLGVRHILSGYDHLLFLGALLLGVRRLRDVVTTVTAFTVAHSATLALAVLGFVQVPAAVVEPLIAASIVWVGVENLVRQQVDSRWPLTFVFGLVHGLGFARALQELGIGSGGVGVALPLGCFNVGVEAGQIGVAILLWPLVHRLNAGPVLRLRLAPVCSALVVAAGAYWLVERTLL